MNTSNWTGRWQSIAKSMLAMLPLYASPTAAEPANDLSSFVETYRCTVTELLQRIHADPRQDLSSRFLIIDRADLPSSYVQCAFDEGDRSMLCEAASGWFAGPGMGPVFSPAQKQALAHLGFAMNGPRENFRQWLQLAADPDLDAVAKLMLTALYSGYGVRHDTVLTVTAPYAMPHGILERDGCIPIS